MLPTDACGEQAFCKDESIDLPEDSGLSPSDSLQANPGTPNDNILANLMSPQKGKLKVKRITDEASLGDATSDTEDSENEVSENDLAENEDSLSSLQKLKQSQLDCGTKLLNKGSLVLGKKKEAQKPNDENLEGTCALDSLPTAQRLREEALELGPESEEVFPKENYSGLFYPSGLKRTDEEMVLPEQTDEAPSDLWILRGRKRGLEDQERQEEERDDSHIRIWRPTWRKEELECDDNLCASETNLDEDGCWMPRKGLIYGKAATDRMSGLQRTMQRSGPYTLEQFAVPKMYRTTGVTAKRSSNSVQVGACTKNPSLVSSLKEAALPKYWHNVKASSKSKPLLKDFALPKLWENVKAPSHSSHASSAQDKFTPPCSGFSAPSLCTVPKAALRRIREAPPPWVRPSCSFDDQNAAHLMASTQHTVAKHSHRFCLFPFTTPKAAPKAALRRVIEAPPPSLGRRGSLGGPDTLTNHLVVKSAPANKHQSEMYYELASHLVVKSAPLNKDYDVIQNSDLVTQYVAKAKQPTKHMRGSTDSPKELANTRAMPLKPTKNNELTKQLHRIFDLILKLKSQEFTGAEFKMVSDLCNAAVDQIMEEHGPDAKFNSEDSIQDANEVQEYVDVEDLRMFKDDGSLLDVNVMQQQVDSENMKMFVEEGSFQNENVVQENVNVENMQITDFFKIPFGKKRSLACARWGEKGSRELESDSDSEYQPANQMENFSDTDDVSESENALVFRKASFGMHQSYDETSSEEESEEENSSESRSE